MNRRNNKKHIDITNALNFAQSVFYRLEKCTNAKDAANVAQECIHEMPKFETQPALKKRYTNILNRLVSGSYTPNIVTTYFRDESQRLCKESTAL